jgi:pilus assembly protein CpaF
MPNYTWDEQAKRKTIHAKSITFMEHFSKVGFNVIFTGPVRSGKTTMLETWQSYEDPSLEGCSIEMTDEIKYGKILPGSPIMELLCNDENIGSISKPVLRSDADYLILAEARRGEEFDLMVRLANKGTNRCKTTLHTTNVNELVYDIADEIMAIRPNAEYSSTLMKVARSYHYVVQLTSLYHDKSKKRMTGIYEICADRVKNTIELFQLCAYDFEKDTWTWAYHVGGDKKEIALRESYNDFSAFDNELKKLSEAFPMQKDNRILVYGGES